MSAKAVAGLMSALAGAGNMGGGGFMPGNAGGGYSPSYGTGSTEHAPPSLKQKCEALRQVEESGKGAWLKSQPWYSLMMMKCQDVAGQEDGDGSTPDDDDGSRQHGPAMMMLPMRGSAANEPNMEHMPRVRDDTDTASVRDPSLQAKCDKMLKLEQEGPGMLQKMRQRPGYFELKQKCEGLSQNEVSDGVSSWTHALHDGMIQRKCQLMAQAEKDGGEQWVSLQSSPEFVEIRRRCEGILRPSPATVGDMQFGRPGMQQGDGAWNWESLAGGLQSVLLGMAQSGATPGKAPTPGQAPDPAMMLEKMSEAVLQKKCVWLDEQVNQLASGTDANTGRVADEDDDGGDHGGNEKKLRMAAAWAVKQPWYNLLRAKCDELSKAADTPIQI